MVDYEAQACTICGMPLGDPDYYCYCKTCGKAVCDDCWLEDESGLLHCRNCFDVEHAQEEGQ